MGAVLALLCYCAVSVYTHAFPCVADLVNEPPDPGPAPPGQARRGAEHAVHGAHERKHGLAQEGEERAEQQHARLRAGSNVGWSQL
jgi:hypothetical protein